MMNGFRPGLLQSTAIALAGIALSCASGEGEPALDGAPSRAVTQGGPQDIAEFRSVVERRAVPDPSLLDELGFFAEHAVDLPPADCDQPVCVHPMLGVAPRFNGGNWTMAFVGMNTSVDPATLPTKPRHLIVLVEDRYSAFSSFEGVLSAIAEALSDADRVSVILAGSTVEVLAVGARKGSLPRVDLEPPEFYGREPLPAVYSALVESRALALRSEFSEHGSRVLWFTGGAPGGVVSADHFVALAELMAKDAIAISTFGMGRAFARDVPSAVTEVSSGNYYYAESHEDLLNAVRVEAKTGFVPLARDFELTVEAQPGYRIGSVYGARRAEVTETRARLSTPTLFIGARSGSMDVATGRRGGGGGLFVELLADEPPEDERERVPADAFTYRVRYTDATNDALVEQSATLATPLGVGQNPPATGPFFSDPERAKPFMMLNMFLALRAQVSLYEAGDCARALGIENMMAQSYSYWQRVYSDPDIDADFSLLVDLSDVMVASCTRVAPAPPFDFGSCFMF